jgi:hypothetical protein
MPAARCHPDRRAVGRGLCSRCYTAARREEKRAEADAAAEAIAPIESLLPALTRDRGMSLSDAIAATETELIKALPEAARAFRRTMQGDPDKGFVLKAAATLLHGFAVPGPAGAPRRLLDTPTKVDTNNAPAQIVIGLHIAAPGDVRVGQVVGTITKKPAAKE